MGRKRIYIIFFTLFIMLISVGLLADSTKEKVHQLNSKSVADVTVSSSEISFQPKVSYGRLVLTVDKPDGTGFSKTFKSGASLFLDLSDPKGQPFIDGSYTYEIYVVPVEMKGRRDITETQKQLPRQEVLSQTGYFLVQGGKIVPPQADGEAPENPLDYVILDDLIVDGSLCVGNDCYSGLAFGFDTIVLMENNLRIFFDDTSTIAGYPNNDWRIIVNGSTSGDKSYFAVEDATEVETPFKIEAGAGNNALYVDSHGDVGIGTSTPYYELHVKDGDSPALRLEQDGSYGWPEQKWDICGNESNFFIRDATHASKLPFRIVPDAPTDSIHISSDGKVGMGTGSPAGQLEVETTGEAALFYVQRTDGATFQVSCGGSSAYIGAKTNHKLNFIVNESTKMVVDTDGEMGIGQNNPSFPLHMGSGARCTAAGIWQNASSRDYKENIRGLTADEAIEALNGLTPVRFNYKVDKEDECVGFIAEDVPDLVATKDRKAMSSMDVVAVLTKVVQEQQQIVREQQKAINELKEKISKLEKK